MSHRKLGLLVLGLAAAVAAMLASTAAATPSGPGGVASLPVIDDSQLNAEFAAIGGATPLATDRTVLHWAGSALDPHNGVTYGFNMVGVDPSTNSAATIPVDIIPLDVRFANGWDFNADDVVASTLASPLFQSNDYSSTAKSTGGPGELSLGNVGQLQDATMRSQFDKVGSGYHLYLGSPSVVPTQTIDVPQKQGYVLVSARGVPFGDVDISWWSTRIQELMNSLHLDPTHLSIFLTNNTMLYVQQNNPFACCVIGYHGAAHVPGGGGGATNGNGNQGVNTFVYASYTTPGTFSQRSGYFVKDIHSLGHEVAEWADDPYINNTVEPWLTPTAPQYGCTGLLETGDPVVGIGFNIGSNSYAPNAFADGAYHPEDEVFMQWFYRLNPSNAQPEQGSTSGRYTLMGKLNPYPSFRQPATGC